jgi:hypothetical protein
LGPLSGLGPLLGTLPALAQRPRKVGATGQLLGGAGALGQQLRAGELGRAGERCVLGGLGASLIGKCLGRQLLRDGPKPVRFGQRPLGLLALGDQRLVLG